TAVELSDEPEFTARLGRSAGHLGRALESGMPIYGVTTGFGGACGVRLSPAQSRELGENLLRYHGIGVGIPLPVPEVRAAMLARLVCLSRGYSGVSVPLLRQLAALLNAGVTPVVPACGSVGASGDLTPMSYIAAVLCGEREAFYQGRRMTASEALSAAGLEPYGMGPKEALSMVNGTSVMTGVALLALRRSSSIERAATLATALSVHAIAGHPSHFHPTLSRARPHPGQTLVAQRLASLLVATGEVAESQEPAALQDPYSFRCSPHVLGVLSDTLEWAARWVEIEANGVSDNPLFEPDTGELLTGGNFYGGHVALAMDALKTAVASVADLSDRQMAQLVDVRFSRGLPLGLTGVEPAARMLHHGFKASQISASALTAEALKLTMPATAFSRSTELHNQDKVSMGTVAARDAAAVCELAASVVAIHLAAAAQGAELRGGLESRPALAGLVAAVRPHVPFLTEDRPLDREIATLAGEILAGTFDRFTD
ncbi:MAG: aromatic amino acid lyase, partial [Deltaproteobacteria bacterium]|nr:aromatic amino acid lyase [Deltaproteobacteria bacterium]